MEEIRLFAPDFTCDSRPGSAVELPCTAAFLLILPPLRLVSRLLIIYYCVFYHHATEERHPHTTIHILQNRGRTRTPSSCCVVLLQHKNASEGAEISPLQPGPHLRGEITTHDERTGIIYYNEANSNTYHVLDGQVHVLFHEPTRQVGASKCTPRTHSPAISHYATSSTCSYEGKSIVCRCPVSFEVGDRQALQVLATRIQ
jgi:hypothetical protein